MLVIMGFIILIQSLRVSKFKERYYEQAKENRWLKGDLYIAREKIKRLS
jgi:hypothetical protein